VLEVVARERRGLGPHDPVAGDLGQDRGGRDRQAGGVAPDDPAGPAPAHEIPVAVEQDPVGLDAQTVDGAPGRQLLRGRHPQLVALLL
jgi:hypothetical protein